MRIDAPFFSYVLHWKTEYSEKSLHRGFAVLKRKNIFALAHI